MGITIGADGPDSGQEVGGLLRERRGIPTQLPDGRFGLAGGRGANETAIDLFETPGVPNRGTNPVMPIAPIAVVGDREGGTAQLLGVEPQRWLLRVVLANGKRPRHGLGCKLIAEPGLVGRLVRHRLVHSLPQPGLSKTTLIADGRATALSLAKLSGS